MLIFYEILPTQVHPESLENHELWRPSFTNTKNKVKRTAKLIQQVQTHPFTDV